MKLITSFFLLACVMPIATALQASSPSPEPSPSPSPGIKIQDVEVPDRVSYQDAPISVSIQQYGDLPINVFPDAGNTKWYFAPLPMIESAELKANLSKLESDEEKPDKVLELPFNLSFAGTELRTLIAEELATKLSKPIKQGQVESLPDEVIRMCFAEIGDKSQRIYCNPPPTIIEQKTKSIIQPKPKTIVSVKGTYRELSEFVKNPALTLISVAGSWTANLEFETVQLRQLANSEFRQKLQGKDAMKNEVSISTSTTGGGGGFELGPVSIGVAAVGGHVKNAVDVQRWVTREHIIENVGKYLSTLDSLKWTEFGYNKDQNLASSKETIANRIIGRAEQLTLTFKDAAKRTLTYVDDQNHQLSVEVGKINGIDLSANASLNTKKDTEEKVNYGAIGGEKKDHLELEIKNDANAKNLGTPIIPTTVSLYQVSDNALDAAVNETGKYIVASRGKNIPVVDAYVKEEAPIVDVGMIVASMIPYEKYSKAFQHDWRPCDGRDVSGTAYARMRLEALGNEKGWVLDAVNEITKNGKTLQRQLTRKIERDGGKIHVPDLRGQFLRGLNVFVDEQGEGPVKGPRDDGRQAPLDPKDPKQPEGEKKPERQTGDWQEDAFARHAHQYGSSSNYGSGDPNAFDARSGSSYETSETGGNETRPRNVAVFYYIKVD